MPVEATMGVDQGCPLSPALFAIGLAGPLSRIHSRLQAFSSTCRVYSYLDDVMVVVPGNFAGEALGLVVNELEGAGLTVNASKTAAWTGDPQAPWLTQRSAAGDWGVVLCRPRGSQGIGSV